MPPPLSNCTEELQTARVAEGPSDWQTLRWAYTVFSCATWDSWNCWNCWKSGITLVRVKIVQVKSGCKMDKWRRDPLTLRQLYATLNWKSAHWKPLAAVFRETFCSTSSRRPRNSLQQRPEGWRSSKRQQENAGNSVVMICRIFRIWQVWHGIGHNFVWWR